MKKIGLLDLTRISKNPKFLRFGMKIIEANLLTGKNWLLRHLHPWYDPEKTNMFWIPVNQEIQQDEDVVLPYEVVSEFIDRSSCRVIVDFCGCRAAFECKDHPHDIGCLMMGEDAKQISTAVSRQVTKQEAHDHLKKALDSGLPPFIGKARIDDFIFGVKNTGQLLTVCFCCDCCCLTRWFKYAPSATRNASMHRLEGLDIRVDSEKCVGCKKCMEKCFLDLITEKDGKAYIPIDCRGCGRCISACSKNAIEISLNNPEFINNTIKRIEKYVSS